MTFMDNADYPMSWVVHSSSNKQYNAVRKSIHCTYYSVFSSYVIDEKTISTHRDIPSFISRIFLGIPVCYLNPIAIYCCDFIDTKS